MIAAIELRFSVEPAAVKPPAPVVAHVAPAAHPEPENPALMFGFNLFLILVVVGLSLWCFARGITLKDLRRKQSKFDEERDALESQNKFLVRFRDEYNRELSDTRRALNASVSARRALELRLQKSGSTQFNDEDLKALVVLCHPDKHGGNAKATAMTQRLNSMRK